MPASLVAGIFHVSTTYMIGVFQQAQTTDIFPLDIIAPEDHCIHIREFIVHNGPYEFLLHEGRIGEKFLPFDGPLDVATFKTHRKFEVGTITPDEPLRLYLEVFSTPSVMPFINCTLIGMIEDWVAPEVTSDRRRRVGEIVVSEYSTWLEEQGVHGEQHHNLMDPLNKFCDGQGLDVVQPKEGLNEEKALAHSFSGHRVKAAQEAFRAQHALQPLIEKLNRK